MRAFIGILGLCALVGAFADEAPAEKTKLDPTKLKGLELYVFAKGKDDKESCYQIFVAERIAQGKDGIGQSSKECKENWSEQTDLGNYNGEDMEKYGQHYAGGSKRGCSAWLKMYADDSLSAVEAAITFDEEYCETNIVLSGPSKLLVKPEKKETQGAKELDPVDYRYKELYALGSDKLCYQIIIGARIAQGKPDIGQSAAECKDNWSEHYDLGNWDGSSAPDYGQHYSGGSRRGCQLWLKMFDDSSLSAIDAKITDDECEYKLTLSAPRALFEALPKATPHVRTAASETQDQEKVTDQFAVSTNALRQQPSSSDASSSPSSPLLAIGGAAVALAAVGACMFQLRRRRQARKDEGEPAE